jgi:GTP-binding protein
MKIRSVQFLKSSPDDQQAPPPDRPEFAFVGRSNVGKSSLINMLVQRKNLAHTSGKPGRTQLINHFDVNDEWYLVDLPGYGYAAVSQQKREQLTNMIDNYLRRRPNLATLFVLMDGRIEPQQADLALIRAAGEAELPLALLLTKVDKLSKNQLQQQEAKFRRALQADWETLPPFLATSAVTGSGRAAVLDYIAEAHRAVLEALQS